jgi:endonuclease YncB( thermonuclease family)
MFGWRKKSEGFEWQEYVRTTILVRRADRQKRLDDVRLAALAKVKDTADRGIEAGKEQVQAVQQGAIDIARNAGRAAGNAAMGGAYAAADAIKQAGAAARHAAKKVPLAKISVPPRLKSSSAIAAMYLADVPRRWRIAKKYLPATAAAAGAIWIFGNVLTPDAGSVQTANITTGSTRTVASTEADADSNNLLRGRASAVSGNILRIKSTEIRLAGVDAPDPAQPCVKANGKRWSCADTATQALGRLLRGRKIACELSNPDKSAIPLAHCRAGEIDIAAELVKDGHVFANEGYFRTYGTEEEAARTAKLGLWQGQNERPSIWRARVWDEAKRSAPDGCPIKGFFRSQSRIYAMPWSEDYSQRNIKTVKGERWFCSEEEARAAGFRALSRS